MGRPHARRLGRRAARRRDGSGASWKGDVIVIATLFTWVGYLIAGRRARATVDVVDFMSTVMPFGLLVAAPAALAPRAATCGRSTARPDRRADAGGAQRHGRSRSHRRRPAELDVGTISIIQVAQPALAVCWALLILGEPIVPLQLPGMALVLAGLAGFTVVQQRRHTPPHRRADSTGGVTATVVAARGARGFGGLRGRPPPPTREPDPGNAGGGTDMRPTTPSSSSPAQRRSTGVAVAAVPAGRHVIAADGGLDHALAAGLDPDVLVGDLDSVSADGWRGRRSTPRSRATRPTRRRPTPSWRSPSPPTLGPQRLLLARRARRPPRPRGRRDRRPRARRRSTRSRRSRAGGAATTSRRPRPAARSTSTCRPGRSSPCSRCTAPCRRRHHHRRPLAARRRDLDALVGLGVCNEVERPPGRRERRRRHRHRDRPGSRVMNRPTHSLARQSSSPRSARSPPCGRRRPAATTPTPSRWSPTTRSRPRHAAQRRPRPRSPPRPASTSRSCVAGDAGTMVSKAVLTAGNPEGDVMYGVDNTFLSRAVDAACSSRTTPTGSTPSPPTARAGARRRGDAGRLRRRVRQLRHRVVRRARARAAGRPRRRSPTPHTRDLLVVENPASSSPGLAFLLATVAEFGEDGWRRLLDAASRQRRRGRRRLERGLLRALQRGGRRTAPLVVSYGSSPPSEVLFADPPIDAPTTAVVDTTCFRQVEFAGVLRGTDAPGRGPPARRLPAVGAASRRARRSNLFVFPANADVALPDGVRRLRGVPDRPADARPGDIAANREAWIDDWTDTVLR